MNNINRSSVSLNMYGHFNLILRNFIIDRQGGESVWQTITSQVGYEENFDEFSVYDGTVTNELIAVAVSIIGLPREPLLEMLGDFYLSYILKRGYGEMLRNLGSNILEFLQNVDSVHAYVNKEYPNMIAPSFRCEADSVSDRMTLHYYSYKEGLFSVAKGLIKSAAKIFYQMELQMDTVSVERETVAEVDGFREHVTVNIIAKKIPEPTLDNRPPTFIAQTKKHSEKQILKADVEAVKRKLERIKAELGEGALPLMKKQTAQSRWKMMVRISLLRRGFIPNYPETLALNPRMFIEIFPYHLVFDVDMKIVQSGIKIQMLMPTIRSRQAVLTDFFTLRYPSCVDLTYENVQRFVACPFMLECKNNKLGIAWTDRPALQIKGQMYFLRDKCYYLFLASPVVRCWQDLEDRKMKLADIPMWDKTRDLIVSDSKCSTRYSNLDCTTDRLAVAAVGRREAGDISVLWETLHRSQRALEFERHKNDALLQGFLPKHVAHIVQRGQVPCGEFHRDVTVLFCDVVQFLPMVAKCSPSDVVGILNSLYVRFDKITRIHTTDKVDSVGDAYVVIAGTGEEREGHPEKVANTALAMMLSSKDVISPLNGESIQIRGGIHTGSIVTGVIGHRVPRFLVMGETAIVASKLESHSVPGKIHVSPTTHRALQNKGFKFEDRGSIELKGYGPINTYFLLKNECVSDGELLGRRHRGCDGNADIIFVDEGKQEVRFDKCNKVHPWNENPSSGVGSRPTSGDSDYTTLQYK